MDSPDVIWDSAESRRGRSGHRGGDKRKVSPLVVLGPIPALLHYRFRNEKPLPYWSRTFRNRPRLQRPSS
ncbi:MAG: hypothetical protein RJA70_95 [Pseudomonadota bacterium]|jgi:hypothetical protein